MNSIRDADLIIVCPSNPFVSIDPILALQGMIDAIQGKPTVAISPLIGGKTIKGPAAKMFTELGIQPGGRAVAAHYGDIIDAFILDDVDGWEIDEISRCGIMTISTPTMMVDVESRCRLARVVLSTGEALIRKDSSQ
jgi:LPPG:FO 2-phospho-L-lactate transferase